MTTFTLKYGTSSQTVELPSARKLSVPALRDPSPADKLVRQALVATLGSPPLKQLVRPGDQVVIVTSDITRYTGSEIYLPIIVDELNRCGISDQQISILIGLGIHRKQSAAEHRKILGPLDGRIAVFDHDCDDPEQLVDLGLTDCGLPVQVNRRVVEADRVIVTGTIGIHYFAGFGGGRKGLVPGVASRNTCMATHFRIFNPPEQGGRNPLARPANLAGNPVHQAIFEAARMIGPDFLLNTVLSPDKQLLAVFAGDLEQAHLAGCELARSLYTV
ncbi:MAG: hypothetical protein C0614_07445, partial [Desulfuromonas sp.]